MPEPKCRPLAHPLLWGGTDTPLFLRVPRPCDYNRILDKYTRFFDLDYVRKNSLDGESVSLEDLLDISTTN